ncbi:MAG: ABC transporter substrate-binding protein [Syntrophorhabdales bacterium]|jgi:branched-chain amino acid transport system substrate-binding protein
MRDKRLWIVSVGVFLLLLPAVMLLGGHYANAAGPKVLKIGTIMPISGPLGAIGLAWDRGFDLCGDMINEQGGLKVGADKYRIEFIHEDGKASPEASAAAANKLVHQDKVNFVMGEVMTPASQAIYEVTKPAGVLHVLTYTQDPYREDMWGIGSDNPLLVLLMPTTNLAYKAFFDYLAKTYPTVKRVVHSESTYPFTRIIDEAKRTAKSSGLEVVGVERYDYGWTDFYPFATAVLKYKPDAISIEHAGPDQVALMIKAVREQGFKGPVMSLGSASPVFILAGANAENCHDIMADQAYAGDPDAPAAMKDVKKRWEVKYPKEPWVDDALMPWDEVWVLSQAIEKANSIDPKQVVKVLQGMTKPGSLKTTFGPGHMGGAKTYGANGMLVRPMPITLIQGEKIKMVKWVTPAVP